MDTNRTIAQKLHESYIIQMQVDNEILDLFEKYEPETYGKEGFDFSVTSDYYDNSIEIFFNCSLPYPYEPSFEIRKAIYDMGFDIVYWVFKEDKTGDTVDEIRGYEPRHYKNHVNAKASSIWKLTKYGYVDERFNEKEWIKKYNFLEK